MENLTRFFFSIIDSWKTNKGKKKEKKIFKVKKLFYMVLKIILFIFTTIK